MNPASGYSKIKWYEKGKYRKERTKQEQDWKEAMKKILLTALNAKYIHSNLGIYSLKAFAKKYAGQIELAEYTINHREETVLSEIYRRKPDILAFSCYIWNIRYVKELIGDCRKVMPDVPIWVGGPEVSYETEQFLSDNPDVDGVMIGEGEATFLELASYYIESKLPLSKIKGIAFRNSDGRIAVNPAREPVCLDEIPFCYDGLEDLKNKILYYETSRGCPYRCSYCLSSIEKGVRFRSMELVQKELMFFLDNQVPQVKFVDRTFNCNRKHAMQIWRFLKEHDNGITNFHFELSADLLEEEDLLFLNSLRPGLVQLEIGVQSTNPDTIKEIHRTMNLERLSKAVRQISLGRNIHQHLDLIAGLPNEDIKSFRRSFNEIYALRPQQLQLGFLKVLKGSFLYEQAEAYGLRYKTEPAYEVLSTNWISYQDVVKLKGVEEMLEVYYNSSQFFHTLLLLEQAFSEPYELYAALSDFYQERGYASVSHTRLARYEKLLEFAGCYDHKNLEFYKELLLFDLYLRENLKSRPSFAKDPSEYKEKLRSFYQEEEKTRHYLPDYKELDGKQLARNTHLEIFQFPVINPTGGEEGCLPLLFDYRSRDPLTKEARVTVLEL